MGGEAVRNLESPISQPLIVMNVMVRYRYQILYHYYAFRAPKNSNHNVACRKFFFRRFGQLSPNYSQSADCRLNSGPMHPCFTHFDTSTQKF